MKIIKVRTSKEYNVVLGSGLLENCGKLASEVMLPCRALIVTDDIVDALYSVTVTASLGAAGFKCEKYVVGHGERSKTAANWLNLLEFLAEKQFHRDDLIVALGGGVVGDLAGFAASTYMRGVKFIQLPTTLLAGIDSSVGGKTAVNLSAGKNLAGTFYQPDLVIFDLQTLKTLSAADFTDGMGEGVKYAVLKGGELFKTAEKGAAQDNMQSFCELCVEFKRDIVQSDERENHRRKTLNLGHTIGHAAEKMSGYTLSHGRAVGAGIYEIARISNKTGLLPIGSYKKIVKALEINGLEPFEFDKGGLAEIITLDKKASADYISFVVIEDIGVCRTQNVPIAGLAEFLK